MTVMQPPLGLDAVPAWQATQTDVITDVTCHNGITYLTVERDGKQVATVALTGGDWQRLVAAGAPDGGAA